MEGEFVDTAEFAGFWKRFAAAFINGLISIVLGVVVGGVISFWYSLSTETLEGAEALGQMAGTVAGWIYYASFESSDKQATSGKLALGIEVTHLNGELIGLGKATGRHFGKIILTSYTFY